MYLPSGPADFPHSSLPIISETLFVETDADVTDVTDADVTNTGVSLVRSYNFIKVIGIL